MNKIILTDLDTECAHKNTRIEIKEGDRRVICIHCGKVLEVEQI